MPSVLVDENEDLIIDPLQIANRLQDHFKSVFSTPSTIFNVSPKFSVPEIKYPLCDFTVSTREVVAAINEIKPGSACPTTCIPARVLKNCKFSLAIPIKLFCEKSFHMGTVPRDYKFQHIKPIIKKGLKTNPANWRPINFTSHVMKIIEREMIHLSISIIIHSSDHCLTRCPSIIIRLQQYQNFTKEVFKFFVY